MIDGQNFFDQPVKNNLRTYDNIRKIETGRRDGYTTSFLLDYNYFNKYYKIIEIDLSKHKHVMLIQKKIQQLIIQEILLDTEMEIRQCFSLLEK